MVGSKYLSSWGHALDLSESYGEFTAASSFDSTAPTSNVFTLGNTEGANNSSYNYIAYCWHSVPGYSAFGSVANLNNDEFVYLGFKPAWVMIKRTSTTSTWLIYDNARNPHNVCDKLLRADTSGIETTFASLDLISNGFKARSLTGISGGWLYMAFAEQPFTRNRAR